MTRQEFDNLVNTVALRMNFTRKEEKEPEYHALRAELTGKVSMTGPDVTITARWSDYGDKKLHVGIMLPRSPIGGGYMNDRAASVAKEETGDIGCDPGRPVEAIIKDIQRRVLPRAEKLTNAANELIEKDRQHIVKLNAVVKQLTMGIMKFEPVTDKYETSFHGSFDDGGWIEVQTSGDNATMKITSTGVDIVQAMLLAVKKRVKKWR